MLCTIVCGGDVAVQQGGSGQVLRGASTTTPLPTWGSKSARKVVSWEIRLSFTVHALCINASLHLSKLRYEKNGFLHVLPWSLGVFIFYITQGTTLLLIWPMSKQLIKDLNKILICWWPHKFIKIPKYTNDTKTIQEKVWSLIINQHCMWLVLIWTDSLCNPAPPDKNPPQISII